MGNIKQKVIFFLISALFFRCACAQNAVAADPSGLFREGRFKEACSAYRAAPPSGKERLIEAARACAYSDEHSPSIGFYEIINSSYPPAQADLLREQADQLRWAGERRRAIETFKKSIAVSMDDPAAFCGLAETLSWDDRLEEAMVYFEKALAVSPSYPAALNGRARMMTWQGRTAEGARLYREALKVIPGDKDALEGLAFALHWSGDDKGSEKTLRELLRLEPGRSAAAGLYSEITSAGDYAGVYASRSYDKNRLAIRSRGVRAGFRLNNDVSAGLVGEKEGLRQRGRAGLDAERYGVNFALRLSDGLNLDSYLFHSAFGAGNYSPFTTNSWLTWKASDKWRIYTGYDRETFEDMNAITNSITTNGWSLSADHSPDRFWLFGAAYKGVDYSDTNHQDIIRLKAERRLFRSPYVKAYYNFYYSGWRKMLDSGYFNPVYVRSNWLGVFAAKAINRLRVEIKAAAGYESQDPASNHPVYYASTGVDYRFKSGLKIEASGDWFKAAGDSRSKGYERTYLKAGLNWMFGGGSPEIRSASSNSRAEAK